MRPRLKTFGSFGCLQIHSVSILLLLSYCHCQELSFTQESYDVVIPENSLGKVYAVPSDLSTKMGIWLPVDSLESNVRFRIKSGDDDGFFKAEAEQVGNFVFLLIRTRTNNLDVLNRERRDSYELDIRARVRDKDGNRQRGGRRNSDEASTIVRVTVKDVNDLDPFFQPSDYAFTVPEDTALHQSVGQVHADDADDGINGEIYFSLMDPKSSFAVDPVTGVISLTRPLSYQKKPRHEITVVAQDRGAKSRFATRAPDTATVHLSVRQVNLHDPSIEVQHLPEVIEQSNADIYAIVRVEDPDEGRHGQVASLEIVDGDPEAHFRIRQPSLEDPNEFNIEVLRLLDREISPFGYNLTLKATDKGYPPRASYKDVHVRLADLNDHAPVFDREIYEVRVNESVPSNTPILRLKATDEDSGANAKVSLSIVAGNKDGNFRINPKSGVLYIERPLDAEIKSTYSLTVTALDHANNGMRKQSSAKVHVYVVDVNDNDPQFLDGNYREINFEENKPAGSPVYTVKAIDKDSGENGYISYSIANLDLQEIPFEIDDFSGQLKSKRLLDYESDRKVYHLKIRASDWGTPYRRQTEMRLTIRLMDINDNRPQFERIGCIGELDRDLISPGASIFTLSALDFDAGNIINYRFVSGNSDGCFSLDAHKGTLSVMCDLRTLPMTSRTLNVTATDGQHFSDVTPIVLNFKGRHQQHSRASNYGVDFQCRETDVASRLTDLMAKAERNNAAAAGDNDQDFHLSSALPSRFGSNVHPPEIRDLPSEISVKETAKIGTKLLKVNGFDRDLGFNGDLLYVISNGDFDSVFKIDTWSGELFVDAALDREETTDYLLNITVQDQGTPHVKAVSKLLHIIVEDVNDNAPQFIKSSFSFFFPENTPKGTPVVTLNATDPDLGLYGQVQFFLEPSDSAQDFSLNPFTGLLSVAAELDREIKEFYDLTIKAEDSDPDLPKASYARVKVRVLDVNDVEPQFTSKLYKLKAREDLPIGTVIGSVQATDPDLYQGGHVKYSLKHDQDNEFYIDEISGTLRIKKRLDFETKQLYNLTVKATDEGSPPLTSFANVIVEVIDVNENLFPPRFPTPFLQTAVPENMPIGSLVTTVQAKDVDKDDKVTFSIKGGDGLGEFYIDDLGNIKTLAVLDREVQKTFWLVVIAQDHGAVPLASRLDVYIEVLDVNDNVPMTSKPVYNPSIGENSKPWTPILKLEASDADDDDKEKHITFEIISGNPQSLFSIDKASGLLSTTTRMLDREAQAEHVLEIMVSDNGIPPLNSTTRVIVNVTDENDNKPEFLAKFQKVTVLAWNSEAMTSDAMQNDDNSLFLLDNDPDGNLTHIDANMLEDFENNFDVASEQWEETVDANQLNADLALFRPLAYDRDAGVNGQLIFSVKSTRPGLFQICSKTGIVYATRPLVNPEEEYELLIKATDKGEKGLFSLSRVSLMLHEPPMANQSLHPPRLLEKSSRVQLFESDPIGHLVALIVADDKDGDKLFYSITDGDQDHDFYINPDKGSLLVAAKLDYERKRVYNLTIEVTDGHHVAQANVIIDVLPVHSKRPVFDKETFKAEVNENEAIGFVVAKIKVAETKGVSYAFHAAQSPSSLNMFKIHPRSGEVSLREKLDMERMRRHVLVVGAKDLNNKDNLATLVIDVLDDNDHEPKFMSDLIQTRLPDNADLGSAVVQVQAYDGDHGLNGELRYSILHGNKDETFVIDPVLGNIILAKEMDNIQTEFMLMIKASDQSIDDKKSATLPVHILVTSGDQDVAPRFSKPHYVVEIKEDAPRGTMVLHAEAFGNSGLFYQIHDHPEEVFRINPSTGHITNQWLLDFERLNFYNFSLSVTNSLGTEAFATVDVHVLDVNDNRPSFSSSIFKGHISETASLGSLILKSDSDILHSPLVIEASDFDSGVNALLKFDILDAQARQFFSIDSSTGALRTIGTLDYETKSRFEFDVRVSDRGRPRLTADSTTKVVIDVDDDNDSPPKFNIYPSEAVLLLPTFAGVPVAQVNAEDPDVGLNSTLKYAIIGGNEENMFKIDEITGLVKVAKESSSASKSQYNLDISVTDGKFNDRKLLTINVERSDNSGLAFAKSRYFTSVLENSTKADVLVIVTVLGADLNENLEFSILNLEDKASQELFSIGKTSGALRTTGKPFDREVQDKYQLVIEVRSQAGRRDGNPRVAHVIVDVQVLDMNDNAPTFMNLPYFATVQRSESAKDASVIKVHAIDADAGQNGDIYYQLVKGNGELFRVGRKSGLVTLRTDLTSAQESANEYTLTIAAYDGGTPPFSAEVVVVIKVVDESIPLFEQQLYTAKVKEDVEVFTPLLKVKASSPLNDKLTGEPHKLIFSVEAGNEAEDLFHIDPDSGMFSTIGPLDYEAKRHHQLRVRATDSLNGGFSEAIVLFEVEDVNDCNPIFEKVLYQVSISEAMPVGSPVVKVQATDADGPGDNSQVEFSLIRSANDTQLSLFNIDHNTGEISLRTYLDRERKDQHVLTVMAVDKGPHSLASYAKVIVNVLDANDNAPTFEEPEYTVRLSDRASRGQLVAVVRAIDQDQDSQLRYNIIAGNEGQVFNIDSDKGVISLANLNSFDLVSSYTLNLSVSDGIYSAFALAKIGLVSANSYAPAFDQDSFEVEFAEGQPEGVLVAKHVKAVDLDRSDSITYAIQSDNLLQLFSIDSLTGEIWSRHMFDREFKSTYEIPIVATDAGGRSGFTQLVVHITDVNDNHPKFELEEYKANVFANLTRGTPVVQVQATDADEGHNADLKYSIYNDKDDKHLDIFKIDPDTGTILLKKNLDKSYENQIFQFFVRAQDLGRPFQLHADVPVEIYIMSQLDRPPIFVKRDHVYYIRENSPVGRVITQLEANSDAVEDGELRYKIASSDYANEELFQIDQVGRVIISGRLDRESKAVHKLTFLAETKTSPTLNGYFAMTIQVLDSNDNAPEFQSDPYDVTVSEALEPGTDIVKVQAQDLDFGNNGEVRYFLEHPLFNIDSNSGWIKVSNHLDAELEMTHELNIKAEDGNGLSALTTVRVHVQDVNDNAHQFSQLHYTAAVNEGALPGNIIFKLMTEDADQVAKTRVEYFILDGDSQGQFGIKSNGEVYVSRPLDRETQSIYKLKVVASDGTFVTKAKVTIEILDDNDNPPECLKSSYDLKISEDTSPGFFLANIEVQDKDEGINAKQIFYLSGDNADMFKLDRDTGKLSTALPLDRETLAHFKLRAHAQDAGIPEWECVSDVNIDISDINDNAPVFSQTVFTASMKEDTPIGAIATKIHATDADGLPANKKLNYDILDSDQFKIDPDSGIVRLAQGLDRELQAMYNVTIRATDQGRPRLSQTASLIILVLDVNDNPPEFASRLYFASVKEDVLANTDVVRVMATSKDSGVNADITYSIVAGNEARKFEIHPKNGMIKVATADLDHERSNNYFLTIQAQDGGDPPLSNHATVNITVQDVNDNSPLFSQVSYSAVINEAAMKGENVISIRAFDADSGENGHVMYSIRSGDQRNQFKIDSQTGVISVANGDLDREMISSYVLEVEAADHGIPVKSSTVLVNVDIGDTNDNPPTFAEDNLTVYVQEDKPFDHVVARFSVTDADIDPNGSPFTFDIRAGNEDNAFRVVQHDGTLRTATKFNHKIRNQYQLQIRAFDNGSPPLFSDVQVTVNIIEESQYPPIIVPMTVEVKSYQDDFPGAMVGRVKASDQDPYDQLSYNLVQDNGLFDIDHSQGSIIALEGLDVGIYTLNISVDDGKFTSYGEAMVTVDLVTDEMLASSVIMRFASVNPEDFILSYQKAFVKTIKNILNVRASDVVILSVQRSSLRTKRDEKRALPETNVFDNETIEPELEVLFMVRKNKNEYWIKEKIRHQLGNKLTSISNQLGLKVLEIQEDECTPHHCQHGKCQDLVLMDETAMVSIATDVISFVAPRHIHEAVCQCDQGFAGDRCDQVMNECAKKPCPEHKLCVPLDNSPLGYKCTCPSGMIGEMCNVDIKTCGADQCKGIVNPMTFTNGQSLLKYKLHRSIERHLSIQFNMRTVWPSGVIFESSGQVDYVILEVQDGKLTFRFNFGTGQGLVMISSLSVDDGHWHQVRLERHGNSAKLIIDNKYEAQGSAPGINDALDHDEILYFGTDKFNHRGFHGCLDNLKIDDIPLPAKLGQQSTIAEVMDFQGIEFKCKARLDDPGVCSHQPCKNGGQCIPQDSGNYICQCPERFQGDTCEIDLDPCASNPCLHGAKCVNLKNDFHCECPAKLSGKRCHYGKHCNPNPCQNGGLCEEGPDGPICQCRGFTGTHCTVDINECLRQNPCHNGGTCINTLGSFQCQCPPGTLAPFCHGQSPVTDQNQRDYAFKLEELVGIIASLFGLVVIVALWVMCRRFKVVKASSRNAPNANGTPNGASYHIQNDFDKESIQLRHPEALYNEGNKLNNLVENDLFMQRPLMSSPVGGRNAQQEETSFNYVDTVRSYGSAADELESLPPTRLTSHDYIQSIQKPMAAVAPSVMINNQHPTAGSALSYQRNMMDYYPNKTKLNNLEQNPRPTSFKPLKVSLPTVPTDSPGLKGAASLSSLPTSTADDTAKYFWDSFDLNNGGENAEGAEPKIMHSELAANPSDNASFVSGESSAPGERSKLLASNNASANPIDPTRDIETLPEDIQIATMPRKPIKTPQQDNLSNADTEDDPHLLGQVFTSPSKPVSTSFEQLLALNDDINFADEDDESPTCGHEMPNSYDYHLHLNSYLPTYHMSENSETDEQTPMLDRRANVINGNHDTTFDVSSEFNASIRALPDDKYSSPIKTNNTDDKLCQLEESDDDEDVTTPVVENKPLGMSRITQV